MNERIRELAEQAREDVSNIRMVSGQREMTWLPDAFEQRFAELIVGECLEIVNRKEYSYHEADPLWETAELIKEHFGVES